MSVPFAAELAVARRAAAEAGALMVEMRGELEVREKAPRDLVTAADEEAERRIVETIRSRFSEDAIVAEEGAADVAASGRRWFVDPIDGTTNYAHGHPFACVSVAFADAEGVAAGVIHAPFLREVFHAARGWGAFLNAVPLRVSEIAEPTRALLATGFPFKAGKGDPEAYFRLVADAIAATQGVRRAGSAALDLAYVAAGRVDAFFEIGLSPWDVAAGMLMVGEAGGRVGGWPGDRELPLLSGRVLASNGELHPWLEGMVAGYVGKL